MGSCNCCSTKEPTHPPSNRNGLENVPSRTPLDSSTNNLHLPSPNSPTNPSEGSDKFGYGNVNVQCLKDIPSDTMDRGISDQSDNISSAPSIPATVETNPSSEVISTSNNRSNHVTTTDKMESNDNNHDHQRNSTNSAQPESINLSLFDPIPLNKIIVKPPIKSDKTNSGTPNQGADSYWGTFAQQLDNMDDMDRGITLSYMGPNRDSQYSIEFRECKDVGNTSFEIKALEFPERRGSVSSFVTKRVPFQRDIQDDTGRVVTGSLDYHWDAEGDNETSTWKWAVFVEDKKYEDCEGYFKILDYISIDDNVNNQSQQYSKITSDELKIFLYFVHNPKVQKYLGYTPRQKWDKYDINLKINDQQYTLKYFNGLSFHLIDLHKHLHKNLYKMNASNVL